MSRQSRTTEPAPAVSGIVRAPMPLDELDRWLRAPRKRKPAVDGISMLDGFLTAIVVGACGASHHWGRTLAVLGHDVKLVAPEVVKPFVKKGKKNDAADAAAICTAAHQAEVKFVPVRHGAASYSCRAYGEGVAGQAADDAGKRSPQSGIRVRSDRSKGIGNVEGLAEQVEEEKSLPEEARQVAKELKGRLSELVVHIGTLETKIVRHARNDDRARRLPPSPASGRSPRR